MNDMARLSVFINYAAGEIRPAMERLLGSVVKMSVLKPAGSFRLELPGGGGGQPCVVARIDLVEKEGRVLLLFPVRFLSKILAPMFSLDSGSAFPEHGALEAAASLIVLEALDCLPGAAGRPKLTAIATVEDFSRFPEKRKFCFVHIKVSAAGCSDILTLLAADEDLAASAEGLDVPPSWLRRAGLQDALEADLRMVCACVRLPASDARDLSAGDVLVPGFRAGDVSEKGPLGVRLAIVQDGGYYDVGSGRVEGDRLKLEQATPDRMERIMPDNDDLTEVDREQPGAGGGGAGRAVENIPVEITVEAGRIRMPVAKIAGLVPGSVVKIDKPLSAEVTLTSSGRVLAYGVLVSVDGEMGVQIMKVVA
ncbi:MAG: FliM/FliN family flagellar motor switch protein [Pseudomonadota bacterium]